MSRLLHRHRRFLASALLGLWAFALFVGAANACCWDGVTTVPHQSAAAAHADGDAMDDGMTPDCEDLGSDDAALLGLLKQVQDPPAGKPVVLAAHHDLGFLPIHAPAFRLARTAHQPPGTAHFLRIVRLTV